MTSTTVKHLYLLLVLQIVCQNLVVSAKPATGSNDGKSSKARTSAHPNTGKQCPFFDGIYTSVMRRIFNQGFHKCVTFVTLVVLYLYRLTSSLHPLSP